MHYDYVDIGTSDFEHSGELKNNVKVLLVEPLMCYYDKLPNKANITKANYAVSNFIGSTEIYYIDPDDIKKYDLPEFLKGCNSIINEHDTALYELKKSNLQHLYKHETVKVITLENLFSQYDVSSVLNLKIDTEGHDHVILEQALELIKKDFLIKTIQFEYFVFGDYFKNVAELNLLLEQFNNIGYSWYMPDKTNMKLYKNS
jgi:FkbM family methyltransferase